MTPKHLKLWIVAAVLAMLLICNTHAVVQAAGSSNSSISSSSSSSSLSGNGNSNINSNGGTPTNRPGNLPPCDVINCQECSKGSPRLCKTCDAPFTLTPLNICVNGASVSAHTFLATALVATLSIAAMMV